MARGKKSEARRKPVSKLEPPPAKLLAAVRARPRDDAPREAVARWYDKREGPRAELIREQLAGRPGSELLAEHVKRWTSEVRGSFVFERGFLDTATISLAYMSDSVNFAQLEALFAAEPVIRDLTMSVQGLSDGGIRGIPWCIEHALPQPLERLAFTDALMQRAEAYWSDRDDGFMDHSYRNVEVNEGPRVLELLQQGPAPQIAIGLRHFGLGDADVPVLVALPLLSRATQVDLRENSFGESGRSALERAFGARLLLSPRRSG